MVCCVPKMGIHFLLQRLEAVEHLSSLKKDVIFPKSSAKDSKTVCFGKDFSGIDSVCDILCIRTGPYELNVVIN